MLTPSAPAGYKILNEEPRERERVPTRRLAGIGLAERVVA